MFRVGIDRNLYMRIPGECRELVSTEVTAARRLCSKEETRARIKIRVRVMARAISKSLHTRHYYYLHRHLYLF
jgi:hypothetical protein